MQPFLEKLANYIHTYYGDKLPDLCLVLPNRRAKLFLRNKLANAYGKPIWAPQIFSIEDFIAELAGAKNMDNLSAAFEFYTVYKEIEQDKAESMDDFLQWAPTLLHDFNELDQYLVNSQALFDYLSDERAIALWNLDGKALTDFQKKYLVFWKSLSHYYQKFVSHLADKKLLYAGLAYRKVAEHAVELAKSKAWHKIIFAGFNALNTAEEKIIKALAEAQLADVLWDSDDYYINDNDQEAGKFIRSFKPRFASYSKENNFSWQGDALTTSTKKIVIAGVAAQVGQAKVAGTILNEIADKTGGNFKNCALVLADENLLMPVLHSIPSAVDKFNVTMGYSLGNLSFSNFVDSVFKLQENSIKYSKSKEAGKARFYYKDLAQFFMNPYTKLLLTEDDALKQENWFAINDLLKSFEKQNQVFIKQDEIQTYFSTYKLSGFESIKALLVPWNNKVDHCLNTLLTVIETLFKKSKALSNKTSIIDTEELFHYATHLNRLLTLVSDAKGASIKEIKTLHALFTQLIKSQSLAFIGEPLEGLQVMGMLETRTLDFETVILLSANEGTLPAGKKEVSFIPLELKNKFGLPTYADKDAIFAYHFYRLLQCAKNIFLVYNTETDEFGSGERSRFITQLLHELPLKNSNVSIEEKLYTIPLKPHSISNKIEITKEEVVLSKIKMLLEKGLSPSLFNTYRSCTLQFYFKYIVGLKEKDAPEESIDAATFGTVLHTVLEEAYTPFIGKKLDAQSLSKSFGVISEKVEDAFRRIFLNGDLSSGKNLLNVKVATKYVNTFLKEEIAFINALKAESKSIHLVQLEKELETQIEHNGTSIKLKGKADRIDKLGTSLRIIDYKTGNVNESEELKLKQWDDLIEPKRNKAFQLLMYAYLLYKNQPESLPIQSGILSFRELSKGLKAVTFEGEDALNETILLEFEQELKALLSDLLNPNQSFLQTHDLDICAYCPYSPVCNR
jgi:ATP-dependent helicase/nuclease subunit B